MNKKQRKTVFTAIILILILVFIITQTNIFTLSTSGVSTLSLSEVDLTSNVPGGLWNGPAWLLTFNSRELGQEYYGSFSNEEIKDNDYTAEKDVRITVDTDPQICRYDIRTKPYATPIYSGIAQKEFFEGSLTGITENVAKSKIPSGAKLLYYGKTQTPYKYFAIYATKSSKIGDYEEPDVISSYKVSLTAGSKSDSIIISSDSQTRGNIGDFAYGIFQGSTVSGTQCDEYLPLPEDQVITVYDGGRWKTTSSDRYTQYLNSYSTPPSNSGSSRENYITNLEASAIRALSSVNFATIRNSYNEEGSGSSRAYASLQLPTQIQFPVTSLYIDQRVIGKIAIFTPLAEVKIKDTSSGCFQTGQKGSITVDIENTGNVNTGYDIYTSCGADFYTDRQSGTINEGQIKTHTLNLRSGASSEVRDQCTVTVETTAGKNTKSVNVCVKPIVSCLVTYPQTFCEGNQVKQCSVDGVTTKTLKTCSETQSCESGECIDNGDMKECGTFDVLCHIKTFFKKSSAIISGIFSGVFNLLTIVKYILVAVGSVISFFFSRDIYKNIPGLKGNKKALVVASLITALGLGVFLAYFIGSLVFWIGIIAVVILGVVLNFVPLKIRR